MTDQEVDAILMADIMQRTDVGMIQGRYGASLAIETLPGIGIVRKMTRQDFDRDRAIEPRVTCAIHLAHAARAERRLNFIRAKFCARDQSHGCAQL